MYLVIQVSGKSHLSRPNNTIPIVKKARKRRKKTEPNPNLKYFGYPNFSARNRCAAARYTTSNYE